MLLGLDIQRPELFEHLSGTSLEFFCCALILCSLLQLCHQCLRCQAWTLVWPGWGVTWILSPVKMGSQICNACRLNERLLGNVCKFARDRGETKTNWKRLQVCKGTGQRRKESVVQVWYIWQADSQTHVKTSAIWMSNVNSVIFVADVFCLASLVSKILWQEGSVVGLASIFYGQRRLSGKNASVCMQFCSL